MQMPSIVSAVGLRSTKFCAFFWRMWSGNDSICLIYFSSKTIQKKKKNIHVKWAYACTLHTHTPTQRTEYIVLSPPTHTYAHPAANKWNKNIKLRILLAWRLSFSYFPIHLLSLTCIYEMISHDIFAVLSHFGCPLLYTIPLIVTIFCSHHNALEQFGLCIVFSFSFCSPCYLLFASAKQIQ